MTFIYNCIACLLLMGLLPSVFTRHQDLRRELASVKDLISNIARKLESSPSSDFGQRLHNIEATLTSLFNQVADLNRKSQLLSTIHQDSDARKDILQKISRSVEEIERKQIRMKNDAETERLEKLSENVQALFQIFGGINRKIDDLKNRLEKIPGVCSTSELKFLVTKKIDSLTTSLAVVSDCLECDRGSLKNSLYSFLRQPLENFAKKCNSGDPERAVGKLLESKWKDLANSIQTFFHIKLEGFNTQFKEAIQECHHMSHKNLHLNVHDIAYSHDTPQELRAAGKEDINIPRETPGRIFRKLWRKMTEPINKVGEKIESLAQTIETSNQKHHNETVAKLKEMGGKSKGGDHCSKQIQTIFNTTKEAAQKINFIESRQLQIQTSVAKILSEVEKVKHTVHVGNSEFIPGVTEAYIEGPGEGYLALSCADLQTQGTVRSGIYSLKPKKATEPFMAYCDLETDGGGWTVIQRRGNFGEEFRQNFTQNWDLYKKGFGDVQREFWIGNEKIHFLSAQEEVILRIELEDFDGNCSFAEYSRFGVDDEINNFRLHVGNYRGNATDSLSLHDGKMFSTHDKDNDEVASCCNCADTFKGGWWYYRCFEANLNGPYHTDPTANGYFLGIIWERWRGDYSLKSSEMKIRPLAFDQVQDP